VFIYRVFLEKDHYPVEVQYLVKKDKEPHLSFAIGSGNVDANGQNNRKP
jgi:hypothetical protein